LIKMDCCCDYMFWGLN